MSAAGRDPQWREAERFAERHARMVLALVDVRVTPDDGDPVDLLGATFAAMVDRSRAPLDITPLERLRIVAGSRTAAFYSRSGYAKTATLWADRHAVALFAYTDDGYSAPVNETARDLVADAQATSERRVLTQIAQVSRRANQLRAELEQREREAYAHALREAERAREAERQRAMARERTEAILGRTLVLLLQVQLDTHALHRAVEGLAESSLVETVVASTGRMTMFERPAAFERLRAEFLDATAALDVLTAVPDRGTSSYRAARRAVDDGLDALDEARGERASGHVPPEVVTESLVRVQRAWQVLVDELVRAAPPAPVPTVPTQRIGLHREQSLAS
ncbi:hypothetical protein IC607_06770 [Cellulomonas sp. JH27-2]|uniref:hypothetical protein n=1 Tax=Cellulomonas sp. JH27-2 TaxID=2774139 RepID=UPI0017870E87|nr:hypothetical protein [Cellulomonas sp. JH27-2]MBD8058668.1 hypothetical protein [Cellulomonas sp. JH27-2]